jgi:peptide deformylase
LSADLREYDEGCLSVPGYYEAVARPAHVKINALDENGNGFEIEADDMLATCIQHEIDHLEGKLFVDYISSLKRGRIRKKLEKQHKQERS